MYSTLKPNKRPRSEFLHYRTLLGMSRQEQCDFSYADLKRFFRVQLWDRSHRCHYEKCPFPNQEILTFEESTLDHIVPRSKGGRTRLSNLQLMHATCNTKKSNKMPVISRRKYFKALRPVDSRRGQVRNIDLKRRGT